LPIHRPTGLTQGVRSKPWGGWSAWRTWASLSDMYYHPDLAIALAKSRAADLTDAAAQARHADRAQRRCRRAVGGRRFGSSGRLTAAVRAARDLERLARHGIAGIADSATSAPAPTDGRWGNATRAAAVGR